MKETLMKTLKPGTQMHRSFAVDRAAINEEDRTVELAFSSEEPYDRWWGREILDHTKKSIRLSRLTAGGPLLMDHDARDHVGVIESVQIGADRVGRAVVRFGKSARAEEIWQDVKDGIRRNVSVGYVIHEATLVEKSDEIDTYRVTDWEPHEISMVAVPADATVGVGRSATDEAEPTPVIELKEKIQMSETAVVDPINVAEVEARGGDHVRKIINEIIAIGEQYKCTDLAAQHIREGKSVEQFKSAVMANMANKPINTADIGLNEKEAKSFSFLRAINALSNPTDRKAQAEAAFERECSDAFSSKFGRSAQGFFVPHEVQRRDLNVTTATAGGNTVATNLLAANFIDMLRNSMMVMKMGAQLLTGLTGAIAIPRQTGAATAYWVAESGAPSESQQAFDQVPMAPKTIGAFTDISRKLLLQSSIDVEAFVRNDLAKVLGLGVDLAAIAGSGAANQPTGVINTSGIGSVVGGTNGLAPAWAHIVELWSDVAIANADFGSTGFLTNAKVAGKLMTTEKASGTAQFVCPGFPDANGMASFGGARAGISNQVPSNLDKGTSEDVCSAILFGNWADLIIGEWGTLDLMVDPYTGGTSGTVRVIALQDIDIAIRHAESFSAMLDALTA
jgi:HK97 family phage major capsid protein/HK97 family phage prohead protease